MTEPSPGIRLDSDRSLWRETDFQKLFTARLSSTFGALIGGLALVAILVAEARPGEMAALTAISVTPGVMFGLSAGAWADRVRRRTLKLIANFGRVIAIGTIPLAYLVASVHIEHLYVVAFALGVFRTLQEVASPAFLPSVVPEKRLLEANSKITAGLSVVETTAFAVGGWIAQLTSAIATVTVQSAAYLLSGLAILSIRKPEPAPERSDNTNHFADIRSGFRFVLRHPVLLTVVVSNVIFGLAIGMIGGQITLFAITEVGFQPGVLGLLFAIGGVASLVGSIASTRLARRFGLGNVMAVGWVVTGAVTFMYPFTPEPIVVASIFFAIPQLGDAFWTIHNITEVSLRQTITPAGMLGRVISVIGTSSLVAELIGAVLGGVIAETAGLRPALGVGAGLIVIAGLAIYLSPVRKIRDASEVAR